MKKEAHFTFNTPPLSCYTEWHERLPGLSEVQAGNIQILAKASLPLGSSNIADPMISELLVEGKMQKKWKQNHSTYTLYFSLLILLSNYIKTTYITRENILFFKWIMDSSLLNYFCNILPFLKTKYMF